MTLGDPLPKRKPEARAGGISVNRPGNVAEALEDPLLIFGRDTNPGIRDADFRSAGGHGLRALTKSDDYGLATGRVAHNLIRLPRLMAQPPEMLSGQCARATAAGLGDDSRGSQTPINTGQKRTSNRFRAGRNKNRKQGHRN